MKQIINEHKYAHYKTLTGIHLTANERYYLCDFYPNQNEMNEIKYEVVVETAQHLKSSHEFVYSQTMQQWFCSNPEDLPSDLIEQLTAQIISYQEN